MTLLFTITSIFKGWCEYRAWNILCIIIYSHNFDFINDIDRPLKVLSRNWSEKTSCMSSIHVSWIASIGWKGSEMSAAWVKCVSHSINFSGINIYHWERSCVSKCLLRFPQKFFFCWILHYIFCISQRTMISHWVWITRNGIAWVYHVESSFLELLWRGIVFHKWPDDCIIVAQMSSFCIEDTDLAKSKMKIIKKYEFIYF